MDRLVHHYPRDAPDGRVQFLKLKETCDTATTPVQITLPPNLWTPSVFGIELKESLGDIIALNNVTVSTLDTEHFIRATVDYCLEQVLDMSVPITIEYHLDIRYELDFIIITPQLPTKDMTVYKFLNSIKLGQQYFNGRSPLLDLDTTNDILKSSIIDDEIFITFDKDRLGFCINIPLRHDGAYLTTNFYGNTCLKLFHANALIAHVGHTEERLMLRKLILYGDLDLIHPIPISIGCTGGSNEKDSDAITVNITYSVDARDHPDAVHFNAIKNGRLGKKSCFGLFGFEQNDQARFLKRCVKVNETEGSNMATAMKFIMLLRNNIFYLKDWTIALPSCAYFRLPGCNIGDLILRCSGTDLSFYAGPLFSNVHLDLHYSEYQLHFGVKSMDFPPIRDILATMPFPVPKNYYLDRCYIKASPNDNDELQCKNSSVEITASKELYYIPGFKPCICIHDMTREYSNNRWEKMYIGKELHFTICMETLPVSMEKEIEYPVNKELMLFQRSYPRNRNDYYERITSSTGTNLIDYFCNSDPQHSLKLLTHLYQCVSFPIEKFFFAHDLFFSPVVMKWFSNTEFTVTKYDVVIEERRINVVGNIEGSELVLHMKFDPHFAHKRRITKPILVGVGLVLTSVTLMIR
jgi:hypothetical protein